MTTFDKREEGFEQQFAHDEALRFKATARRNKMLGLWAAEKLGMSGAEADSYALSVVMLDVDKKGDVAREDPQGLRRQRRRAIRAPDRAYDERIVGASRRRHQSRPLARRWRTQIPTAEL